jgi:hypothetical protein
LQRIRSRKWVGFVGDTASSGSTCSALPLGTISIRKGATWILSCPSSDGTPPRLFDRYFGLKEDLEELLGRPVDLVMEGVVSRNAYFAKNLAETRVPLYAD